MFGTFNFKSTPLAPPEVPVLFHEKFYVRGSWSSHALKGWYIGYAPKYYRCHTVFITSTRSERTGDTVEFLPHSSGLPVVTEEYTITHAAAQLADALRNPSPPSPFATYGNQQLNDLHKLSSLFSNIPIQSPQQSNSNNHANPRVPIINNIPPNTRVPNTKTNPSLPILPNSTHPLSPSPTTSNTRAFDYELNTHTYPTRSHTNTNNLRPLSHLCNSVSNPTTGQQLEYRHLISGPHKQTWEHHLPMN